MLNRKSFFIFRITLCLKASIWKEQVFYCKGKRKTIQNNLISQDIKLYVRGETNPKKSWTNLMSAGILRNFLNCCSPFLKWRWPLLLFLVIIFSLNPPLKQLSGVSYRGYSTAGSYQVAKRGVVPAWQAAVWHLVLAMTPRSWPPGIHDNLWVS